MPTFFYLLYFGRLDFLHFCDKYNHLFWFCQSIDRLTMKITQGTIRKMPAGQRAFLKCLHDGETGLHLQKWCYGEKDTQTHRGSSHAYYNFLNGIHTKNATFNWVSQRSPPPPSSGTVTASSCASVASWARSLGRAPVCGRCVGPTH